MVALNGVPPWPHADTLEELEKDSDVWVLLTEIDGFPSSECGTGIL